MKNQFYLVTVGGREMGSYPTADLAKEALSPLYQEKVKLLTQDEFSAFTKANIEGDPAGAVKNLGILLN